MMGSFKTPLIKSSMAALGFMVLPSRRGNLPGNVGEVIGPYHVIDSCAQTPECSPQICTAAITGSSPLDALRINDPLVF